MAIVKGPVRLQSAQAVLDDGGNVVGLVVGHEYTLLDSATGQGVGHYNGSRDVWADLTEAERTSVRGLVDRLRTLLA